jgi:hypothetical protein
LITKPEPPSGGFWVFQRFNSLEFAQRRSLAGHALGDANTGPGLIEHGNAIGRCR